MPTGICHKINAQSDLKKFKCLIFLLFQELILVDSAEEHEGDTGW